MKILLSVMLFAYILCNFSPSYAAFPIKQVAPATANETSHAKTHSSWFNIPNDKKGGKDNGVTALVLGIIGLVLLPYGVVCSILAIVFGSQSLHGSHEGQARAGMILGIIGVGLFLVGLLLFLLIVTSFKIY